MEEYLLVAKIARISIINEFKSFFLYFHRGFDRFSIRVPLFMLFVRLSGIVQIPPILSPISYAKQEAPFRFIKYWKF